MAVWPLGASGSGAALRRCDPARERLSSAGNCTDLKGWGHRTDIGGPAGANVGVNPMTICLRMIKGDVDQTCSQEPKTILHSSECLEPPSGTGMCDRGLLESRRLEPISLTTPSYREARVGPDGCWDSPRVRRPSPVLLT